MLQGKALLEPKRAVAIPLNQTTTAIGDVATRCHGLGHGNRHQPLTASDARQCKSHRSARHLHAHTEAIKRGTQTTAGGHDPATTLRDPPRGVRGANHRRPYRPRNLRYLRLDRSLPTTRTLEVLADVAPGAGLKPGTLANVDFGGFAEGESLFLPASAVRSEGGRTAVLVVAGGKAQVRAVEASQVNPGTWAVRGGLDASAEVILDPGSLAAGDPVVAVAQ